MFITKENIKENVDVWVKRKIYTKEQGDVIILAVMCGFQLDVSPVQIPQSYREKIIQKLKLSLTIE